MPTTIIPNFEYRIHYKETTAVWKLSSLLLQHIPFHKEPIVICCIGTDRSTGDSFGPLTGLRLSQYNNFSYKIIGTLEHPLHALNLSNTIESLENEEVKPFIIAIDACLGNLHHIGELVIQSGSLLPGQAVGKDLPPIGDISIKGIVNVAGFMEHSVLQSTRLHIPFEMSKVIAQAIMLAAWRTSKVEDSIPLSQ